MSSSRRRLVLCNGSDGSELAPALFGPPSLVLDYRDGSQRRPNVRLGLPDFVGQAGHLSPRTLDLLEIAGYVYCADRSIRRGKRDDLEFHGWSRSVALSIRVRDFDFWNRPAVSHQLSELLTFLSGDADWSFSFQTGHSTPQANLFDAEGFTTSSDANVLLFSGGIDSLAGALDQLHRQGHEVCLVTHGSGRSSQRTQTALVDALVRDYGKSVSQYRFECHKIGARAREETQRTRFFLYGCIAFALAEASAKSEFFVHENGITSLNFPRRGDMLNARASRTTHPRTIALFSQFLSSVHQDSFRIATPFFEKTKAEVIEVLRDSGGTNLLPSSVSCSRTFKAHGFLQCGECAQCIDRRFAASAAGLGEIDDCGVYQLSLAAAVADDETRTLLIDYLRQAGDFAQWDLPQFYQEELDDLVDVVDYVAGGDERKAVQKLWDLCSRHGRQVMDGAEAMRRLYKVSPVGIERGSILDILNQPGYAVSPQQPTRRVATEDPVRLFISYAHEDDSLRAKLENHLAFLRRGGTAVIWHDRCINAGADWETKIDANLASADVILLLVSSDFVSSDYCYCIEMNAALERHSNGEATVIPVIARPCYWKKLRFARLEVLPKDGKPIVGGWRSQDHAFTNVAEGIDEVVEGLRGA